MWYNAIQARKRKVGTRKYCSERSKEEFKITWHYKSDESYLVLSIRSVLNHKTNLSYKSHLMLFYILSSAVLFTVIYRFTEHLH